VTMVLAVVAASDGRDQAKRSRDCRASQRRKEDKNIFKKILRNARNSRNCGVRKYSNEVEARLVILAKIRYKDVGLTMIA